MKALFEESYVSVSEKKDLEPKVKDLVEDTIPKTESSKLSFGSLEKITTGHCIVRFYGGLNGNGNWSDYFKDLTVFLVNLNQKFGDAWTVSLYNDCLDDVFYIDIGLPFGSTELRKIQKR